MKEIIYSINKRSEKRLTGTLRDSGVTSFYIEYTGKEILLKIYSDDDTPLDLFEKETLISVNEIENDAWNRTWGDNYRGHKLTESIFVLPDGLEGIPGKYSAVIRIDQYDSFGDGHHPTTRLCAELLSDFIDNISVTHKAEELSMLDIATGSGILSIAAWIMGIRDIELFDYEPVAVEKAAKNLELNGITSLNPFIADIYSFNTEKKYDLITANLLSRLLEDNIEKIKSFLKPDGILILSGIGATWTDDMINLFRKYCFEIIERRELDDWNGFLLTPLN